MSKFRRFVLTIIFSLILASCSTTPKQTDNICSMLDKRNSWYQDANRSYKKWGVPVHVQMAIIHQESRFNDDARPERKSFLWIFPGSRPSSAYGYAQVLDSTWQWYINKSGNNGADRDDFGDVTDFIGWYGNLTSTQLKVSKWDAYGQYLAYHEGHGGYSRGSYWKKPWLVAVAKKVKRRADSYAKQLYGCRKQLEKSGFWF